MLPEGSRKAESRGPQGWSMGSEHFGAGCSHLLEDRVEIVDTEHDHWQNALGEQFLQGVAVGLGPARGGSDSTIPRPG